MLSFFKKIILILLVGTLTSCAMFRNASWIENRDTDYLKAYSVPPLIIPPGLSTSTIHAHYPVPERNYPPCTERINLRPPELVQYVPAPRRVVREPVCAEPMPVSRPIMSISVPFARHPVQPVATEQQTQMANNYYDSFTRSSSSSSNKSGLPLGSIFPMRAATKAAASAPINTSPATGSNTTATKSAAPAPAPASNSPQSRGILNSLNSFWPWNRTQNPAPTTAAAQQPAQQTTTPSTTNSAENTTDQKKDFKKFQYYDRFTRS